MRDLSMGIDVGHRKCVIYAFSDIGEVLLNGVQVETNDKPEWRSLLEDLSSRRVAQPAGCSDKQVV